MASDQSVLDCISRALWDPRSTAGDDRAQLRLAEALGYPPGWRVVRRVETVAAFRRQSGGGGSSAGEEEEEEERCVADRIYSGEPDSGCDCWFHHEAAMRAADAWNEETSTPHDHGGGHLLPPLPAFDRGDKVQVLYEGEWWDATVQRRRQQDATKKGGGGFFTYQVYYAADGSKQTGVEERFIRHRLTEKDPAATAAELGLPAGWRAWSAGHHKYKVQGPDGQTYKSKRAALEAVAAASAREEGDPPWRTTGSEYLGRRILWKTEYKASARRSVTLEQLGEVVGWISETDVDSAGEPGFVSEATGRPAVLYHIKFQDEPHHPYATQLLDQLDVEEYELLECLLPEEEDEPTKKKART
jgi:hypothetical protein